jgi:hypothetical protein
MMRFGVFFLISVCVFFVWTGVFISSSAAKLESPTKAVSVPTRTVWITGFAFTKDVENDRKYQSFILVAMKSASISARSLLPVVLCPNCICKKGNDFFDAILELGGILLCFEPKRLSQIRTALPHLVDHSGYGPYMRLFLSDALKLLMKNEDVSRKYVLYTDNDVLFLEDPVPHLMEVSTKFIAIGPELRPEKMDNSGVLWVNMEGWKTHEDRLFGLAKSKNWNFIAYDQGLLLEYFVNGGLATQLPSRFNHKIYWGSKDDAVIVHFHAMKPGDGLLECGLKNQAEVCVDPSHRYYFHYKTMIDADKGFFGRFSTELWYATASCVPFARKIYNSCDSWLCNLMHDSICSHDLGTLNKRFAKRSLQAFAEAGDAFRMGK